MSRSIFCKSQVNWGNVRRRCPQNSFIFSYVVPSNEYRKIVKYFLNILSGSWDFVLKDWSIFGENMHLISDYIFKAVFCLKYPLRNILSIWYGKLVLKVMNQKNMNSKVFNFPMRRNCSRKSQKYEFWTNFLLQ